MSTEKNPLIHQYLRHYYGVIYSINTKIVWDVHAIMHFSFDSRVGPAALAGMGGEAEKSRFCFRVLKIPNHK